MFWDKYKYRNWKENYPTNVLEYFLSPASWGLRIVNFIFQKVFRINAEVPFMVHYTSIVSKTVFLGRNVAPYLANSGGCYIQGINTIYIGDHTMIAPGVKIISANHDLNDYSKHDKSVGSIRIGANCWIGANAVILPGVELGDNVIVGAGSVVTKSFGRNIVIAGNPAKEINKM
jgi:acetyltransferase-like isoleucine patch superfamily enzyme